MWIDAPEPMLKKYLEKVLKEGVSPCPFCGCEDTDGHDSDLEKGRLTWEMHCLSCDSVWIEVFMLTTIRVDQYDLPKKEGK